MSIYLAPLRMLINIGKLPENLRRMSDKLQNEIKAAIKNTGFDEYFGILLRYTPASSESVELNWEKDRESRTTSFDGDRAKFKDSKLYNELFAKQLIETSWIFYRIDPDTMEELKRNNIKPQLNCGTCWCSHCGSHCNSHK
eukprot:378934_1